YWLMSRPEIKNAEQLKRGSVAISNFGAAADFVARYALDKLGLVPGKDVTIVQVGGISDRLGAVLVGRVQATVLSPPVNFIETKERFKHSCRCRQAGSCFSVYRSRH